jgi:hypothetical protein
MDDTLLLSRFLYRHPTSLQNLEIVLSRMMAVETRYEGKPWISSTRVGNNLFFGQMAGLAGGYTKLGVAK